MLSSVMGMLGLGKIQLAAGVGMVAVIGLLYLQNHMLRSDLDEAYARNGGLETALQMQEQAVMQARRNAADWADAYKGLLEKFEELKELQREATQETRRLNDIFSKHDLGALALAKPGLVERRINAGTADVLSVLERATSGTSDDGRDGPGAPTGEGDAPAPPAD